MMNGVIIMPTNINMNRFSSDTSVPYCGFTRFVIVLTGVLIGIAAFAGASYTGSGSPFADFGTPVAGGQ
jgi:hypothetical protein